MRAHITSPRPSGNARSADRTGPIGRLLRLVLFAIAGVALVSIVDQRGRAGFREASVLTEPGLWVLTAVMLALFITLIGALALALRSQDAARRWQVIALTGLAVVLAAAAVIGQVGSGAVWGFPLSDVAWWFVAIMLVETLVALILAVILGTPGCEIGVWVELIARTRGRGGALRRVPWIACLAGLHLVDGWETRRRGSRDAAREARQRTAGPHGARPEGS